MIGDRKNTKMAEKQQSQQGLNPRLSELTAFAQFIEGNNPSYRMPVDLYRIVEAIMKHSLLARTLGLMTPGGASGMLIASNDSEDGRAMNRRVTFHVFPESVDVLAKPYDTRG